MPCNALQGGSPSAIRPSMALVWKYLLQQVFYQQLGQLHSIEGRAFAYVI
jgi:hypothetical protein